MAKIIIDQQEATVNDNESVIDTLEELGVPFGCQDGKCGTCLLSVVEGMKNLVERNEKEINLCSESNQRLGCQMVIKGGTVKVEL